MYGFNMACIELYATGPNSITLKARIWQPVAFKEDYPPKPIEAEPSFRKASLPIAKLHILFPAYLWVREFWPQTFSF